MKRRHLLTVMCATALSFGMPSAQASNHYPDRPIQIIVPWGAGGGTDAVARFMAAELKKKLGQPVNVVNRTGGSGVVGHSAIASAKPDGYTLGLITVEVTMMRHLGLTDLSYKDFTPIALVNYDPNAVFVRTDSDIKNTEDLLAAIKTSPGKLKGSGTGQGGIWHLGLAGMLVEAGLPGDGVTWVPSQGAAPGLQDLMAGGIDLASCSLPEARALIEAGRVKPLVLMDVKADNLFPDVPLLKSQTGSDWTNGAWRGLAGPAGMPDGVITTLSKALEEIYQSDDYAKFLSSRGFGAQWAGPKEFGVFMEQEDSAKGKVLKAVGLAK